MFRVLVFTFFNKTLTQSSVWYENILVLSTFWDFTAYKRASVLLLDSKQVEGKEVSVRALAHCLRVKCSGSIVYYFFFSYKSSEISGPRKKWSIWTASKLELQHWPNGFSFYFESIILFYLFQSVIKVTWVTLSSQIVGDMREESMFPDRSQPYQPCYHPVCATSMEVHHSCHTCDLLDCFCSGKNKW